MEHTASHFGPFRLVRRLGVGGMAETFEAARQGPGDFEHRVCLKRVLPAYSDSDEFVRQFEREARLAAELTHSNIVSVLDFGAHDETHYIALELVDGIDLRALLGLQDGRALSPEIVAVVATDLAYALDHAHSLGQRRSRRDRSSSIDGVVHRDVSPANVLISRAGEVKLADFGIAKAISDASATASATMKGKIPYMAPEQMSAKAIDGRADLFSLGVVLFEALAGRRPFDGVHDVETMRRILDGQRVTLAEVAPHVPKPFAEVVEGLIATDPNERTQSAAVLVEQLAEAAPPSPQVRRQLATLVETLRGGVETREHVRAEKDLAVVAPIDVAKPPTAGAEAPERVQSGSLWNEWALVPRRTKWMWIAAPLALFAVFAMTQLSVTSDGADRDDQRPSSAQTDSDTATTGATQKPRQAAPSANAHAGNRPTPQNGRDDTNRPTPSRPELSNQNTAAGHSAMNNAAPDANAATPAKPKADTTTSNTTKPNPDTGSATSNTTPSATEGGGASIATAVGTNAKPPRQPAKPLKGALRVTVIPRGKVWIDRKYMGESSRQPYPLKAGVHLIQAGFDSPDKKRRIRIRPGKTTRIEFDLDE